MTLSRREVRATLLREGVLEAQYLRGRLTKVTVEDFALILEALDEAAPRAALADLTADRFADAFIRIRGAHSPTAGELEDGREVRPCAWCRLAGQQAAEAAAALIATEAQP